VAICRIGIKAARTSAGRKLDRLLDPRDDKMLLETLHKGRHRGRARACHIG
jgi:hypothetical protein